MHFSFPADERMKEADAIVSRLRYIRLSVWPTYCIQPERQTLNTYLILLSSISRQASLVVSGKGSIEIRHRIVVHVRASLAVISLPEHIKAANAITFLEVLWH